METARWQISFVTKRGGGAGMMVSAFISREFGFGLKLSRTQLDIVNRKRDGEVYVDLSAAVMKMGTDKNKH
jgi:hypothetical protein